MNGYVEITDHKQLENGKPYWIGHVEWLDDENDHINLDIAFLYINDNGNEWFSVSNAGFGMGSDDPRVKRIWKIEKPV